MSNCYLTTIVTGTTWSHPLKWSADGNPVDITGYTARMQFRRGTQVVQELTSESEDGGIVVGGEDGEFTLSLTPEQTAALPVGTLDYDLLVTSATGVVTQLVEGGAAVIQAVTRDD